jgi:ADP-ribose pyrophosphatase
VTDFRRLGEEVRYRGPFLTVVGGMFESPGGDRFEREFIRHPGAVAIVPFVDPGTVLLVRQFRAAIGMDMLEIPAGLLDVVDEEPEVTARRELEEETGRRVVGELEPLVEYFPAAGMADHRVQIYVCRESEPCDARPHGPEEGHMTVERVRLDDAAKLIAEGQIVDGKTIVGLLLAARST